MKIKILSLTQINSPEDGGSLFPGFYGSVSGIRSYFSKPGT